MNFEEDSALIAERVCTISRSWEGKASILEMKEATSNWKQMEWWAFYFELLCGRALQPEFEVPGDKINRVTFDLKRSCNWDLKAKAIKSDSHDFILNDLVTMDETLERYGEHGLVVGLCDVEYNDTDRTFQKWHSELKGGRSRYEIERERRTAVSRYRKTSAELIEVLILRITKESIDLLDVHSQGRNSNGLPRPPKYRMNLERIDEFLVKRIALD